MDGYTIKIIIPKTGPAAKRKVMYWDYEGPHFGRSKTNGFVMFDTEKQARKFIKHLKVVLAGWYEFHIIPHSEIPFIKKQRRK